MRFLYARFTNRKTHATGSREYTFTSAATGRLMRNQKKIVKNPCYVTIDISRAFPPKQTQVKICLQIQRELSGGQFSLSLYLKLFRTISNSSYNTTASSRHRSAWKKKITEKKYRHLRKVWILSFLLLCRQAVFALITVKFPAQSFVMTSFLK